MGRDEFVEDADPTGPEPLEVDLRDAVGVVRQGAAAIDRLWSQALGGSSAPDLTLALGEASHALHRALMALDHPASPEPVPAGPTGTAGRGLVAPVRETR